LSSLFPADPSLSRLYVVTWVADDPTDDDGDVTKDGVAEENPGRGVLLVAATVYGMGLRRTVEVAVERTGADLRILGWYERRL
jgi:hypothetical protein